MPNDTQQEALAVPRGRIQRLVQGQTGRFAAGQDRAVAQPEPQARTHLGAHAIRLEQLGADRERQGFARRRPGDHGRADQRLHGSDRSRLRSCGRRPTQDNDAQSAKISSQGEPFAWSPVIPVMVRTFDVFRAGV